MPCPSTSHDADLASLARVVEYLLVLLRTSKKVMPEEYRSLMDTVDRIKAREETCTD